MILGLELQKNQKNKSLIICFCFWLFFPFASFLLSLSVEKQTSSWWRKQQQRKKNKKKKKKEKIARKFRKVTTTNKQRFKKKINLRRKKLKDF